MKARPPTSCAQRGVAGENVAHAVHQSRVVADGSPISARGWGQPGREAEAGEQRRPASESGDPVDPVAADREHHDAVRFEDAVALFVGVGGERRLAVGACGDELDPVETTVEWAVAKKPPIWALPSKRCASGGIVRSASSARSETMPSKSTAAQASWKRCMTRSSSAAFAGACPRARLRSSRSRCRRSRPRCSALLTAGTVSSRARPPRWLTSRGRRGARLSRAASVAAAGPVAPASASCTSREHSASRAGFGLLHIPGALGVGNAEGWGASGPCAHGRAAALPSRGSAEFGSTILVSGADP
jgi:hypothetical protein